MKKLIALMLLAAFAAASVGCGGGDTPTSGTNPPLMSGSAKPK